MSRSDMIAAPSAASVGATAVPMIALTAQEIPGTSVWAITVPSAMVSGSPISSRRPARA